MTHSQYTKVELAAKQAKIPITRAAAGTQRYSAIIAGKHYTNEVMAINAITTQYLKRK